jgi:hypothetical protein
VSNTIRVRATMAVVKPGAPRRLVADGNGGQRNEGDILPEDGVVDVEDTRYYRRRIAMGDLVEVHEQPAAPVAAPHEES